MKRIRRKLSSERAETLVELLAAVCIISMGLMLFASSAAASARIRMQNEERLQIYSCGGNQPEAKDGGTAGVLTVREDGKRVNIGASQHAHKKGCYSVWLNCYGGSP